MKRMKNQGKYQKSTKWEKRDFQGYRGKTLEIEKKLLIMRNLEIQKYTNRINLVVCSLMLCYDTDRETKARRLPFFYGGIKHPPNERKEGDAMVTYSDMIQFCIFIVALVGLCYEIFKGKRR